MNRIALLLVAAAVLGTAGCKEGEGLGHEPPADRPPAELPRTEVPDEIVGAWEHGAIDFDLWEKYKERYYAGRNASPTREAMVFRKNGDAKFYRYEFAFGVYEELVDCEGTVTFGGDGTFTFHPAKGRKRFYDTRNPANNKDRALTAEELKDPRWAGKRRYAPIASSEPAALKITVPGSAPYNWYKKP
ncbi:MAG TPA: hypothetical protein VIL46_13220 [Gemmataceae bacterium]